MDYDAENRITSVGGTGHGTEIAAYDGDGRRVMKEWTPNGGTGVRTFYTYDLAGRVAGEYSEERDGATQTMYPFTDMLGSVRAVATDQPTSGTASIAECYDYSPYGRFIPSGTDGRGSCYPSRPYDKLDSSVSQKFTGKERDLEVGLDFFRARYLAPAQGRFTSADPFTVTPARVIDPQQLNLYAYVRNNPLKHVDPTGMILDDAGCLANKQCAKNWRQIQGIATKTDKNGNFLHPELYKIFSELQTDSRTFTIENSKLTTGTAGLFTITDFTNDGKDFTHATIQIDFNQLQNNISSVSPASLVPGFNKFEGLLNSPSDRFAETFGHEGAHGIFSIQNPSAATAIQQLLNERDDAMKGLHFPYPPDVMQLMDAATKGLIPTETFAQQEEKIVNGELQADKKKP